MVLAMRGGPISTRRVVLEDPSLQEVIDYVEANGEDMWNDLPASDSTQVTVLLFRLEREIIGVWDSDREGEMGIRT